MRAFSWLCVAWCRRRLASGQYSLLQSCNTVTIFVKFQRIQSLAQFILMENRSRRRLRFLFWVAGLALLFALYTSGLKSNPPGFYLDESAPAYNAYLLAHTGAGEFGKRFPLYFQYYTDTNVQVANPAQVYMLAAVFRFFPPSILLARMFSAFWVFTACLLLGLLAQRISGRRTVGVIVAVTALLTPWFFEGRGLLLEPQFLSRWPWLRFFWRSTTSQKKERWGWLRRYPAGGDPGTDNLLLYERTAPRSAPGARSPFLCYIKATPDWRDQDGAFVWSDVISDPGLQSEQSGSLDEAICTRSRTSGPASPGALPSLSSSNVIWKIRV